MYKKATRCLLVPSGINGESYCWILVEVTVALFMHIYICNYIFTVYKTAQWVFDVN